MFAVAEAILLGIRRIALQFSAGGARISNRQHANHSAKASMRHGFKPLGLNFRGLFPILGQHGSLKTDALNVSPLPLSADGPTTLCWNFRKAPRVELGADLSKIRQLPRFLKSMFSQQLLNSNPGTPARGNLSSVP